MKVLEVVLSGPGDDDLITLLGHMTRLASGLGVNVVEETVRIVEVVVLAEIAGSFVARGAAEGHVERDEARALRGRGGGLGGLRLWLRLRRRFGFRLRLWLRLRLRLG